MRKLETLRAAIEAAIPDLAASPERMIVQAKKGTMVGTGAASDSFEYRYTAEILVMDLVEHPDTVVVPVMRWAKINQPDHFFNPTKREASGIRFEAEVLSNSAVDLMIEIDLTENVVVVGTAASWKAIHTPEPPEDPADPNPGVPWVLVWPGGTDPDPLA